MTSVSDPSAPTIWTASGSLGGFKSVRIEVGRSMACRSDDRVTAITATHPHRRFVRMLVVLYVGKRHPLRFELIAELGVQ